MLSQSDLAVILKILRDSRKDLENDVKDAEETGGMRDGDSEYIEGCLDTIDYLENRITQLSKSDGYYDMKWKQAQPKRKLFNRFAEIDIVGGED
jgi:hypothetical protein